MQRTLRRRIFLTITPLVLLPAILGVTGVILLNRLGGRVDLILRENYASVRAMFRLNEALERIDSSFQFALAGQDAEARTTFDGNWTTFERELEIERQHVTVPGERELVDRLDILSSGYLQRGRTFFARPAGDPARRDAYFEHGLLADFRAIKHTAGEILLLNQENMERASDTARTEARTARTGFALGLGLAALLALLSAYWLTRAVVRPIAELTDAAVAVGSGNLDLSVPTFGRDELGRLARAFNDMTAQLRDYRRSNAAQLIRAQKTAQATIDSFADPVLVVDPAGGVEMANPAARQLFGVSPAGTEAAPPWAPPEPLRQPLTDALTARRAFQADSFDQAVMFRLHGDERAYLPQVLPISDRYGYTLGAAIVLKDVTGFRHLDQLKSDLVATVSHELKTPLTNLRLAVHLLLEETVGPLTPKQTELLLDARESAERLLQIIEHLLALARLQQREQRLQLRPHAPVELLRTAADAYAAQAQDRHINLVIAASDDVAPVNVDPGRMVQALSNLVDNALSHTDPGGTVTLSAAATDRGVRFTVADTGTGIAADALPHVFDRFYRAPDSDRPGSTGLGLAIVREIAEAHGGTADAESTPGRGSAFHLTLPSPLPTDVPVQRPKIGV